MQNRNQSPLQQDALRYLRNTLNEVLNGLRLPASMEAQMQPLRPAMKALHGRLQQEGPSYEISVSDALLLLETCAICELELEKWEFDTRLGYSRAEAEQVMAELREKVRRAHRPHAAAS